MTHKVRKKPENETMLENLARSIKTCSACYLEKTRKMSVPGEGSSTPSFVVVGEAPGKDENECGRPFIGKCGALLRETLDEIGVSTKDIFICNTVKCRTFRLDAPKYDRAPTIEEMRPCCGFLREQLLWLASSDRRGFPVRRLPVLALGKTALEWFAEFLWTKKEFDDLWESGKNTEYESESDFPTENAVRHNNFPKGDSQWERFAITPTVENAICGKPLRFTTIGEDGDAIEFSVYALWHPSYVLHGGMPREKYMESMRGIVEGMR